MRPDYSVPVAKIAFQLLRNGEVLESGMIHNAVVTQGIQHKNDVVFGGTTPITTWRILLLHGSPATVAPADTYQSASGWSEVTNYTEASRPEWQGASSGTASRTNAANPAEFTIGSGGADVSGAAFVGGPNSATKGNNAAGNILMGAGTFGTLEAQENDVIRIIYVQSDALPS